jgi:hypothetical protein
MASAVMGDERDNIGRSWKPGGEGIRTFGKEYREGCII